VTHPHDDSFNQLHPKLLSDKPFVALNASYFHDMPFFLLLNVARKKFGRA
jgi:hypothetical protein